MTAKRTVATQPAPAPAANILNFWSAGNESLARIDKLGRTNPAAVRHGRKAELHRMEAQHFGGDVEKAKLAARFAAEYTRAQVQTICALVKKYNSTFSTTNVRLLLAVEDRTERDRITQQAIKESWSTEALKGAIQARHGIRRPKAGREPELPGTLPELLIDLHKLAGKWCRRCQAARPHLPHDLHPLIDKATKEVGKVQQALIERLETSTM